MKMKKTLMAAATVLATIGMMALGAGPASAASGVANCTSQVRISSVTYAPGYSVTHWWTQGGGNYRQWFTPGSRSNLPGYYYVNWTVTPAGYSLGSASGTCSGIV
jgi:hypothetical protein